MQLEKIIVPDLINFFLRVGTLSGGYRSLVLQPGFGPALSRALLLQEYLVQMGQVGYGNFQVLARSR